MQYCSSKNRSNEDVADNCKKSDTPYERCIHRPQRLIKYRRSPFAMLSYQSINCKSISLDEKAMELLQTVIVAAFFFPIRLHLGFTGFPSCTTTLRAGFVATSGLLEIGASPSLRVVLVCSCPKKSFSA